VITKTDSAKPDSNIGLMLDDKIVEKLSSAVEWLRSHRHPGVKEIAGLRPRPRHSASLADNAAPITTGATGDAHQS
jgi:hypothetical protein